MSTDEREPWEGWALLAVTGYRATPDGRIWSAKSARFLAPHPVDGGYLVVQL